MELTDILKCPKTGNNLRFDESNSVVYVENSDLTYPIIDGIIDFCPQTQDAISRSYDAFASLYDKYMTSSNVFMKVWDAIIWKIPGDCEIIDTILSYMPSQFDGILLDVPVGTGLFTSSLYAGLPNATIIAVDYSMGMLKKARNLLQQNGLSNVHLLRADVANLPVRNSAVDILLSMAGLHVFPDKQSAVSEMRRVIRERGTLIASFYAQGARKLPDWFVRHFLVRRSFFNPPFFHVDDIASQFEGFTIGRQGSVESFVYFEAVKKGKEN